MALDRIHDLIVIGAGMGGLATASLAARRGLRVALLESHSKLGGCAGWFDRGPYTFDAGATALMGMGLDEPIGRLLDEIGLEFEASRTPSYRVCLPDRTLDISQDAEIFVSNVLKAFPGQAEAKRRFWSLQAAVGNALFETAKQQPRLPIQSLADLAHDLRILGLGGLLAASTWLLTVDFVLQGLRLKHDRAFRSLIAMLLQDTAQAGPEQVPFANASACLQAYRLGMSRPKGGMRALSEGIGRRFEELGGVLKRSTIVDRVEADPAGGFRVTTRRRQTLRAKQVVFNLPIDLAGRLLGRSLAGRLGRQEKRSRAAWSAFTGYVVLRREAVPDCGPYFYQVLQDFDRPIHGGNNVLISLSPIEDLGYGPPEVRVATMSTHTRPSDWEGLSAEEHAQKKASYREELLKAMGQALPEAPGALLHEEFATPRSFARYTRRQKGAVGGPPVRLGNSNFFSVGNDALGPGLWLVGDSVFPGQGTMAVVLSAMRVVDEVVGLPRKCSFDPLQDLAKAH